MRGRVPSRGFTLVELLVVVVIIIMVSVVALPTVLPALAHRQVSEAGRVLQGSLVGARVRGQCRPISVIAQLQLIGLGRVKTGGS